MLTNQGGASDFIEDGINGFLRDPQDRQGMAKAAITLLSDDNQRQLMIEEGVRHAGSDFGAQCVMKQYLDLYDRLLAGGMAGS